MSERLAYRITERAGAWIAGYRRPATPTILLTPAEAEYDLLVGTIELIGPPPVEPVSPRLLLDEGDFLRTFRGSGEARAERNIVAEALEAFLIRDGSALDAHLSRRGDEIGIAVAADVAEAVAQLTASSETALAALRGLVADKVDSADLGTAARKDVGLSANDVAGAQDGRIVGALQRPDDATSRAALLAALLVVLDTLPNLPAEPTGYPTVGGLYRNGDVNGYTLTRIYPVQS